MSITQLRLAMLRPRSTSNRGNWLRGVQRSATAAESLGRRRRGRLHLPFALMFPLFARLAHRDELCCEQGTFDASRSRSPSPTSPGLYSLTTAPHDQLASLHHPARRTFSSV